MSRLSAFATAALLLTFATASWSQVPTTVTRTVAYTYTAQGEVATETMEPGNAALQVVTTYTRAPVGGVDFGLVSQKSVQWTDPVSTNSKTVNVQQTLYDTRGRFPIQITDALGHIEYRSYDDGFGNLKTDTDHNSLITTYTYDTWGRKLREDRPDGTASTTAYRTCIDSCTNAAGSVAIAVTVTQNWYGASQTTVPNEVFLDVLGRTVMTRTWGLTGLAVVQDKGYDSLGYTQQVDRPRLQTASAIWTSYLRDAIGRVQEIHTPKSTGSGFDISSFIYSGRTLSSTNAKTQHRSEVRNVLGKVESITDDAGKTTAYYYEPFGNLSRTRDPLGNQIDIKYDTRGHKTNLNDPDLGAWQYSVDPVGRTYKQVDAKGQTTSYTYDDLNRLQRRLEPDEDSNWQYDSATKGVDKLAQAYTVVAGSHDYQRVITYDAYSRTASVTTSLDWDYVTSTSYDGFARPSQQDHTRRVRGGTGGVTTSVYSTYNAQGYADKTYRLNDGTSTLVWQAIAEDAEGHLTVEGLGAASGSQHGYNAYTGWLESIASGPLSGGAVSATLQNDVYQYDVLGNLNYRAQLVSGGTLLQETFGYDTLNRLTQSQLGSNIGNFGYDAVGDIAAKTNVGNYTYPLSGVGSVRPHAVSDIAGSVAGLTNPHFSYDGNGNLASGLNRVYTWMASDQPSVIDKTSGGATVQRTQFLYGPDHERIRQTISPIVSGNQQAPTDTVFYAGAIEKEIDVTANVTIIRTAIPGIGYVEERIAGTAVAATATATRNGRLFLKDHLGSTLGIMDESGVVLQRMSYDAWGRRRNVDGSDDSWASLGTIVNAQDNSGYTGHEQLDQLGLVDMNARFYDPITGRHTSADPTVPDPANAQAFNRYSYVLNNALAFTDPTGLGPLPVYLTLTNPFFAFTAQMTEFEVNKKDGCSIPDGVDCQVWHPPEIPKEPGDIGDPGNLKDPTKSSGLQTSKPAQEAAHPTNDSIKAEAPNFFTDSLVGRLLADMAAPFSIFTPDNVNPLNPAYIQNLNGDKNAEAAIGVLTFGLAGEARAGRAGAEVLEAAAKATLRGLESEARVLQELGLSKNKLGVSTPEGRSIPDALTKSLSIEIKDAANVSLTRQLRIQTEAARESARQSVLITGQNSCVSGPCSRAFDTIIRRSDLGPK